MEYRVCHEWQAAGEVGYAVQACAVPVDGAVIVESTVLNKATAVDILVDGLRKKAGEEYPVDFMLVVGDGREDEVALRSANEQAGKAGEKLPCVTTVSLGSRNTEAKKTLTQGFTGVLNVLQRLAALT